MWKLLAFALLVLGAQGRPSYSDGDQLLVKDDLCKEGDKIPDPDDCQKFKVCENNKLVDDNCVWFRKFDSVEKRCMWWGATCAVPNPAPTTAAPSSAAPSPPPTTAAPNPAPKEQKDQVKLRKLQSVEETPKDGDCKNGDKIADENDCHKYKVCENNKLVDDKCFWFRKFDSVENRCMWWGATCAVPTPAPTTAAPTPAPTTAAPTPAPTTAAPNPQPKELKDQVKLRKLQSMEEAPKDGDCKNGDKIAEPNDCRKYKLCTENKLVEKECFGFQKFDSIENRCTWWGAKCALAI